MKSHKTKSIYLIKKHQLVICLKVVRINLEFGFNESCSLYVMHV